MPDGSQILRIGSNEFRDVMRSAMSRMHDSLVEYGNVYLRGGGALDPDPPPKAGEWTGMQKERARAMHRRVTQLPELRLSLIIQVFYKSRHAHRWIDIIPELQIECTEKMAREVNFRLRKAAQDAHQKNARQIRPTDFHPARERAMRILCNNERINNAGHA